MTIYRVYGDDPMSSLMSWSETTIGYFKRYKDAQVRVTDYNKNFKKGSMFRAKIETIEVKE